MELDFQFEFVSTIFLLRDYHGNVIKTSKKVPDSFYYMEFLGNDFYRDPTNGKIWLKKDNSIIQNKCVYFQEEYTDVTVFWNKIKELTLEAKTDPLTQVFNVRGLEDKKLEILSLYQNCILVMSDVNSFKKINDVYGHTIGDQCLIEIAKVFKKYITKDDLVGRIGGDEFLLVFVTDDIDHVKEIMVNIQKEVEELGKKMNIPLSISIGISLFRRGDNWEQKKAEADMLSYQNKNLMKKLGSCPKNYDNA